MTQQIDYSQYTSLNDLPVGAEFWVKMTVKEKDIDDAILVDYGSGWMWVDNEDIPISSVRFAAPQESKKPQQTFQVGDIVRVEMVDSRWEFYCDRLVRYEGGEYEVAHVDDDGDVTLCGWNFKPEWLSLVERKQEPELSKSQAQLEALEEQVCAVMASVVDTLRKIEELKKEVM